LQFHCGKPPPAAEPRTLINMTKVWRRSPRHVKAKETNGLCPATPLPQPPEATPKSRGPKRFARADKDDDGRITSAELFEPRRKAFAKLDANGNGALSFEEWAVKTVNKFQGADKDRSGWLTPAEYSTTAPKPAKRPRCAC